MASETLIERLREPVSDFQRATYNALQAGNATKHQQQSAAAGIALARSCFSQSADTLEALQLRVDTLEKLVNKQLRQKASAAWDAEAMALLAQPLMSECRYDQ